MKKYILTIMLFSLGFAGYAQVGIGTASPTLTLEVVGANDNGAVTGVDGVLVPRVNDTDMSTATNGTVDGQMVYNTVAKKFYYWNGTAWTVVGGVAVFSGRTSQTSSSGYDWTNSGDGLVDFYEFTSNGGEIILPSPVTYSGVTIYVRNNTGGTRTFGGADGVGRPKGVASLVGTGAMRIWSDGTYWHNVSGRQ